jgi:hypothetical protein
MVVVTWSIPCMVVVTWSIPSREDRDSQVSEINVLR